MTGQDIATHCKQIFSKSLIHDKGSCYEVEAFPNMMKEYDVNHITSSPHYSQSNGLAEMFVQVVNNLFHKKKEKICLNAVCNPQCK